MPAPAVAAAPEVVPAAAPLKPGAAPTVETPAVDIQALLTNPSKPVRDAAIAELVDLVRSDGTQALEKLSLREHLVKALTSSDKKTGPLGKEAVTSLISTLCEQGVGKSFEPIAFQLADAQTRSVFALVTDLFAEPPKSELRLSAITCLRSLLQVSTPWSVPQHSLPVLLAVTKDSTKWQAKLAAMELLDVLVLAAPEQVAREMQHCVPVLTDAMGQVKVEVQKKARETLTKMCDLISNKDIEKFIPALIDTLKDPKQVPKTIGLLAATTFVSEVDSATLSLMVPLLVRGISERETALKRKVGVIVDNMTKLVDNENTVRPFLPSLLPGLIKMKDTVSDPEARGVVEKAIKTLRDTGKVPEGEDGSNMNKDVKVATAKEIAPHVAAALKEADALTQASSSVLVQYLGGLAAAMVNYRNFEPSEWTVALAPYVSIAINPAAAKDDQALAAKAQAVVREILDKSANASDEDVQVFDDEEEGEDLCNCTFSLAYGAKILLNTATMRLKRGHRYGLCGRNGTGKSTLMRSIHQGQVNGFPSPDEVRTFYVEHDIDGSEAETSVFSFILSDSRIEADEAETKKALTAVGFSEERQEAPIGSLSGGWKMKLALARAMLFKADILLLDEPTNHLDVVNVKWLEDYLCSLTTCTSIIVSHDSGFLNNVVTDVLHLNRFKLKRYPGNLHSFVKYVPEAKAYFELAAAEDYTFQFPKPPLLEGVKTKEKSIMKMRKVNFQYQGSKAPQLNDITLQVSLSSRVAILGPNGAGKSTLVKLLVGEIEPNMGGEVWKHPALVVGYVAQHAFHHIDKHLDKTPLQYLIDRYQTGEDAEELDKETRQITKEDEDKMKAGSIVVVEGQKRIIDEISSRRKLKNSWEYEVSFKNLSTSENVWLPRDELFKRGYEKTVLAIDTREAQKAGLLRPLVRREVEKHMAQFGLEAEFVSHNTMRGLSGGQKVKVVLAAATWRMPHVVVVDEPSNYLDRESLAALIEAFKTFEGGVLIITHSRELSESVCSEVWAMKDGGLTPSGHNWVEGQGAGPRIDKDTGVTEDKYDAMGNKVDDNKAKKKQSASDARKKKKERMARRKRGEEVFSDEDDE